VSTFTPSSPSPYPPPEALRSGTQRAAEALARGADLGTLEPGKLADLLVIDGDPAADVRVLRDKRRIVRMLKAGEEQPVAPERAGLGAQFVVAEALAREGLAEVASRRR